MAKKQKRVVKAQAQIYPVFSPGQVLALGGPTVVADVSGQPWLIDPILGTAAAVGVIYRGGREIRQALGRQEHAAQSRR